ncbi:hypothetical protein D3C87_921270 [compost metagenome]
MQLQLLHRAIDGGRQAQQAAAGAGAARVLAAGRRHPGPFRQRVVGVLARLRHQGRALAAGRRQLAGQVDARLLLFQPRVFGHVARGQQRLVVAGALGRQWQRLGIAGNLAIEMREPGAEIRVLAIEVALRFLALGGGSAVGRRQLGQRQAVDGGD